MRAKRQDFRNRTYQSIKKISEGCYDLTAPALVDHVRPLLCQTELITRTQPRKYMAPSPSTKPYRTYSTRTTSHHRKTKSYVSAFSGLSTPTSPQVPQDDPLYHQMYNTRAMQLHTPSNSRLYSLFKSRLSHAISNETFNASRFQLGPLAIKQVCLFLKTTTIQVLNLSNNNLSDEGVIILSQNLKNLQHLNTLSLASVNMGEKGSRLLLRRLRETESLQELDLSSDQASIRNRLNLNALENVSDIMGSKKCNIKVLKLNRTALDDHNFQKICKAMNSSCLLRRLEVSNNEITKKGMDYFKGSAIQQNLEQLDISQNRIIGGGLNELAYLLGSQYGLTRISKSFKILKSRRNKIRSSLFVFFSHVSVNQTLEEIYLSQNPLGEGSISTLSSFLSRSMSLKKLDLSYGHISTSSIMQLCNGLEHNSSLQVLNLSHNMMDSCGLETLLQAVAKKRSLSGLYIDGCGITDAYILNCEQTLLGMKFIEELRLRNNFITDEGGDVLERVLFANKLLSKLLVDGNSMNLKVMKLIKKAAIDNNESKKYDSAELNYYSYIEEKQDGEKEELKREVENLRREEEKLSFQVLLRQTAMIDHVANDCECQLREEYQKLKKIEGRGATSNSFVTSLAVVQDLQIEGSKRESQLQARKGYGMQSGVQEEVSDHV